MGPAILVLAGRRSVTTDTLAARAGVTHKAIVPVGGEAMVGRVLRIAEEAYPDAKLYVSVDDPAAVASEPTVARLRAGGKLTILAARANIVDSVVEATRTTGFPLLITTADNVLMTPEGMRAIVAAGAEGEADAIAMMAERADILDAHPDGQRRFYAFRGGAYSNCNLFWLGSDRALRATDSFRLGGQFAKHKRRAVKALGLATLFLYLSRLLTLDGMFRHLSRRFGVRIRPLVTPDGRLAIDVDNERTFRVAEELLARHA